MTVFSFFAPSRRRKTRNSREKQRSVERGIKQNENAAEIQQKQNRKRNGVIYGLGCPVFEFAEKQRPEYPAAVEHADRREIQRGVREPAPRERRYKRQNGDTADHVRQRPGERDGKAVTIPYHAAVADIGAEKSERKRRYAQTEKSAGGKMTELVYGYRRYGAEKTSGARTDKQ